MIDGEYQEGMEEKCLLFAAKRALFNMLNEPTEYEYKSAESTYRHIYEYFERKANE